MILTDHRNRKGLKNARHENGGHEVAKTRTTKIGVFVLLTGAMLLVIRVLMYADNH